MSEQKKDELLKTTTKIVWCETKQMSNGNYMSKIKAENGDHFTLFHTKKDGTDSKAFAGLKELPMSWIGTTVDLLYKEEPYEREGKTYTSRKVIGLKKSENSPNPTTVANVVAQFNDEPANDEIKVTQIPF